VPDILLEHGKAANPWPNVDAHSGVLLRVCVCVCVCVCACVTGNMCRPMIYQHSHTTNALTCAVMSLLQI